MAVWKIDITKAVKDTAERALNEYQYKGNTIREWADKCGNCGAKMDIDTGDYYTPKDGGEQ